MKYTIIGRGRTADIYDLGENRILKLFHTGLAHKSVEHEYRLGKLIQQTNLPVPKVYEIRDADGRPGIVYEKISGSTLLTSMVKNPVTLLRAAKVLASLHLHIHGFRIEGLPGQKNYLIGQINRVLDLTESQKHRIICYLNALPAGKILCHGDFHPDNIIMSPNGPVIIDWLNASIGNPAADVARTCLLLQAGAMPPGVEGSKAKIIQFIRTRFNRDYKRIYLHRGTLTSVQVEQWLLPVAAARMVESPPGEMEYLLAMVENRLKDL